MTLNNFSWKVFESTGSIDSFLLYKDLKPYDIRDLEDKHESDEVQGNYSQTD